MPANRPVVDVYQYSWARSIGNDLEAHSYTSTDITGAIFPSIRAKPACHSININAITAQNTLLAHFDDDELVCSTFCDL